MPQSDRGRIELWYDGFAEDNIALTAEHRQLEGFSVGGQGNAEVDSGVPTLGSDGLSGVGVLTTTDQSDHAILIGTNPAFDMGLMAPFMLEARVRLTDLDTKEVFIGVSDVDINTLSIEVDVAHGATTTITLTATHLCGFLLSAELNDDEDWHMVFNGGSATGVTASGDVDADDDAVAGEWQVLRLEIDPNGTARWYIDGVIKQTQVGAVSTTADLGVCVGVEAKGNAIETMDVDFALVRANRDWTV